MFYRESFVFSRSSSVEINEVNTTKIKITFVVMALIEFSNCFLQLTVGNEDLYGDAHCAKIPLLMDS